MATKNYPSYELLIKGLESLLESNCSKVEDNFIIRESLEKIKKIDLLRSKVKGLGYLDTEIEQLNTIESELIHSLHCILNYNKINQVRLHSESLSYFMFHISCAAFVTMATVMLILLLTTPITTFVGMLLSLVIISALVLFQANSILAKDESPLLSSIKITIDASINQVKKLINEFNETVNFIENKIDDRHSSMERLNLSHLTFPKNDTSSLSSPSPSSSHSSLFPSPLTRQGEHCGSNAQSRSPRKARVDGRSRKRTAP